MSDFVSKSRKPYTVLLEKNGDTTVERNKKEKFQPNVTVKIVYGTRNKTADISGRTVIFKNV